MGTKRFALLPLAVALAPLLAIGVSAQAADITWSANGGTGGDWAVPANWNGGVLPGSLDQAVINAATSSGAPAYIQSDVGTIGQIDVQSGQFLEVHTGGAITTPGQSEDSFRVSGTVTQSDGTVTVSSNALSIGYGGNGTYTISGGTLNTNRFYMSKSSTNTATFNQTGGTVNDGYGGSDSNGLRLAAENAASVANLNFSGGTFNSANGVNMGASGSATMNFSGSAKVSFTSGNDFNVRKSGDTLMLNGSRTGDGTNVQISGALKLSSDSAGSTLQALIDSAAVGNPSLMREINVSNRVEFDNMTYVDPDFTGVAPTAGTWTILTWTSSTEPNPANLSLAPGVASGWSYNLDTTANTLSVTYAAAAVPEPASLGLLGMGAIGLLARRRRKTA